MFVRFMPRNEQMIIVDKTLHVHTHNTLYFNATHTERPILQYLAEMRRHFQPPHTFLNLYNLAADAPLVYSLNISGFYSLNPILHRFPVIAQFCQIITFSKRMHLINALVLFVCRQKSCIAKTRSQDGSNFNHFNAIGPIATESVEITQNNGY